MKLASFTFVVAFVALVSGCASKPSQPDWVAGEAAKYPATQYLSGRGIAASQEEARDRARADLAKIFQVAVVADTEDVQSFKSDAAGGQFEGQATRRISTRTDQIVRGIQIAERRISTRTDQIVRGIQIAELWQDPVSRNHYALAVLPRLQAAAALRQQIGQVDDGIKSNIEQSRKSTDLFLKIAAASRALDLQTERDSLQKSLQVVDVTGRGLESQFASAKLKADLDELLKRVRVSAQASSDSPAGLNEIVSGALAQAGFLLETGDRPDFSLKARMNLTDMGLVNGWYWQRGTLEVTLTEVGNGRVRGTKRWPIKASATDKDTAIKRAMGQADDVLKKELGGAIIEMATSR